MAEVKAAYRKQVKQFHPDQGGSHEEFLALQAAYEEALRLCRYHP
jgi:curved DNA-binding protein CbpA